MGREKTNYLICAIALLLFFNAASATDSYRIFESQNLTWTYDYIYPNNQQAQSFTTDSGEVQLDFIEVTLRKVGNPTFTNIIFNLQFDGGGAPNGTLIDSGCTSSRSVSSISSTLSNYNFSLPAGTCKVTPGQKYWIIGKASLDGTGNSLNTIGWEMKDSDPYRASTYSVAGSIDNGGSWTLNTDRDRTFKLWGHRSPPNITTPVISPSPAYTISPLTATWTYSDADGDPETNSYSKWYVNSVVVAENTSSLSVDEYKRGDNVTFEYTPCDTYACGETRNTTITIVNAPATVSGLSLSPSPALNDYDLTASYIWGDADGDGDQSYTYWLINGTQVLSGTLILPNSNFNIGDNVSFVIVPFDGYENSTTQQISVTITNYAPNITDASNQTLLMSNTPEDWEFTFLDYDLNQTHSLQCALDDATISTNDCQNTIYNNASAPTHAIQCTIQLPDDEATHILYCGISDGLDTTTYNDTFDTDKTPPTTGTLAIDNVGGKTNDTTPNMTISSNNADYMRFSCDESSWTNWIGYTTSYDLFDITSTGCPSGDGLRTVYVEFSDFAWNIQTTHASDTVILNSPPVLTVTITGSAENENITCNWTAVDADPVTEQSLVWWKNSVLTTLPNPVPSNNTTALDNFTCVVSVTDGMSVVQGNKSVTIAAFIDLDADGYNASIDCNDNNAAINPGATEINDNDVDENCDGIKGTSGGNNNNGGGGGGGGGGPPLTIEDKGVTASGTQIEWPVVVGLGPATVTRDYNYHTEFITFDEQSVDTYIIETLVFDKDLDNVIYIVTIPKEFAESASQITVEGLDYIVLEDDPVLQFNIGSVLAGDTIEIKYIVHTEILRYTVQDIVMDMSDPIVEYKEPVVATPTPVPTPTPEPNYGPPTPTPEPEKADFTGLFTFANGPIGWGFLLLIFAVLLYVKRETIVSAVPKVHKPKFNAPKVRMPTLIEKKREPVSKPVQRLPRTPANFPAADWRRAEIIKDVANRLEATEGKFHSAGIWRELHKTYADSVVRDRIYIEKWIGDWLKDNAEYVDSYRNAKYYRFKKDN